MGEHSSPAAMALCRNRVASQKLPDIDPDPGDDDDYNKGGGHDQAARRSTASSTVVLVTVNAREGGLSEPDPKA